MTENFTVFRCDVCEWAATTGAPWERCPHCDTRVPPSARQVGYVNTPAVPASTADALAEALSEIAMRGCICDDDPDHTCDSCIAEFALTEARLANYKQRPATDEEAV